MKLSDYLNTDDAAKFVGLHTGSLRRFRAYGQGPKYHKANNGRIHYRRQDLLEWMKEENRLMEGNFHPNNLLQHLKAKEAESAA